MFVHQQQKMGDLARVLYSELAGFHISQVKSRIGETLKKIAPIVLSNYRIVTNLRQLSRISKKRNSSESYDYHDHNHHRP